MDRIDCTKLHERRGWKKPFSMLVVHFFFSLLFSLYLLPPVLLLCWSLISFLMTFTYQHLLLHTTNHLPYAQIIEAVCSFLLILNLTQFSLLTDIK